MLERSSASNLTGQSDELTLLNRNMSMYRSLWSDHYNKISSNLRANTNSKKIRRKAKLVYAPISSEPSAIEVFFFQLPKTHSATGKSICGNLIDFNCSKITILAILHIIFKYPPNIYKLLILVLNSVVIYTIFAKYSNILYSIFTYSIFNIE